MTTLTAKVLADFTTSLASALAIGATTATLQSATDDDGVALPSGQYYFTLDGSNSSKEHIRCTLSGTSLTSIYSISRQGVATSGTVRAHRLGATVTLTDFAHIKVINDLINGTTALDSTAPLKYDGVADMTSDTNKLATVKYVNDTAIAGAPDSSTTTKGIVKMSTAPASATEPIAVGTNDTRIPTQDENDALTGTSGTPSSSNKYVTNDDTRFSFGGTGADGALTITSGVTTIDLGGIALFRKDYTSISITGTGSLAFTNPNAAGTTIKLYSRGDVTLTSSATPMINASGLGGAGTNGGAGKTSSGSGNTATTPANQNLILDTTVHGGIGATAGVAISNLYQFYSTSTNSLEYKVLVVVPGIGGTGGASGEFVSGGSGTSGVGGNGGTGGGGLYIECAGAWNFTTANGISVAGINATNGGNASGTDVAGGGGGAGGAGGMFLALYRNLTANSGTINISGGTGGTGGTGNLGFGGAGGASGGTLNLVGNNGGTNSGSTGGTGGNGKDGFSLVALNKYI